MPSPEGEERALDALGVELLGVRRRVGSELERAPKPARSRLRRVEVNGQRARERTPGRIRGGVVRVHARTRTIDACASQEHPPRMNKTEPGEIIPQINPENARTIEQAAAIAVRHLLREHPRDTAAVQVFMPDRLGDDLALAGFRVRAFYDPMRGPSGGTCVLVQKLTDVDDPTTRTEERNANGERVLANFFNHPSPPTATRLDVAVTALDPSKAYLVVGRLPPDHTEEGCAELTDWIGGTCRALADRGIHGAYVVVPHDADTTAHAIDVTPFGAGSSLTKETARHYLQRRIAEYQQRGLITEHMVLDAPRIKKDPPYVTRGTKRPLTLRGSRADLVRMRDAIGRALELGEGTVSLLEMEDVSSLTFACVEGSTAHGEG